MKKFLSFVAAMLFAFTANAAVININNETPDALRTALSSAQSGDEIVMAAGTYVESNSNYIAFAGKDVTVKAAEGAEVIIQPQVPFTVSAGGCAHLVNLKIDASRLNEKADWYEHVIYPEDADENNRIILQGCEFYNFNINKSLIYCSASNKLGAVNINGCYFHNIMKSVLFIEATAGTDVLVANSTFANIETNTASYYAGVLDTRATAGSFSVQFCTFYNVLAMNTDYGAVGKVKTPEAVVANSIFMLPESKDGVRAIRDVKSAINCITYNYLKDSGTGIHSDVAKTNCVQVDPKFVNAAEGNFTLGEGSPALTLADGDPIGDPRWIPAAPFVPGEPEVIYLKPGEWAKDNAKFGVYAFVPNVSEYFSEIMAPVEGETGIYKTTIPANYTYVVFMRLNDGATKVAWDQIWNQTKDLQRLEDKDMFAITSWGEGEGAKSDGEWSKYVPAAPLYGVAEIIAAGLKDSVDARVQGVITKMEFKGKNFAKYGSVNIYVKDATGKEGEVEFYNCYSLEADTFKASVPEYDATSTAWKQFEEITDASGRKIHLNDTVIAEGKYVFYQKKTHELISCNITDVKHYVAPEPQHTYTVAGAPAVVFGEEWNASYEENDMEFLANQSYTWIKDSVVLRAGTTVQFKVVEDHAWAKAWPEQNYQLAIPEDGYYSIIIAFNLAADPDSIVEAKAVKVGEIEPTVEHIFFTQACAKDSLASDAKFGSEIFNVTITDTDNKMEIDANNVFFGSDSIESVYNFRLKTGGKSGAKNFMTINIPEDGLLAIAVRTSNNADSTRTLVLVQGEDTLYNKVVKESDAVKYKINDSTTISLYPYVVVPVKAGQVTVTYPVGALNFYAFAFTNQIPEPTHTYTVAGAPATLFGKEWNASYAENDMESYGTDTYFWRRDSVALAAGNVEFKIVEDHSWSKGWPAQNYVLKIDSAGLYNITIMFKPKAADPDSMVSAIAYKVADAVVLPKIIMHGNFTGSWADTEEFAIAEDNLTASLKLNLTAGSYEFGMKFDGVWKANAAELTREAPETSLLEGNGNMKITADVDGEYTFTYTFLGEKLAVTYPAAAPVAPTTAPAAPTAAEDDVLAIYCNHYTTNNLNFGISGWAGAYQVLDLEGTNVGYWTAMTWECIIDPAHTDDAHDLSGYKKLHVDLWAPKAAKIKFTVEAVAGGNYKDGVKVDLAAGWNSFDFVVAEWTGNYDFKNVKCFVFEQYQTPAEESFEGNPFAFANIYLYDKEPQAIDNIDANTKATKTIVNGMLIIEKNGKTYNVLGTLVK